MGLGTPLDLDEAAALVASAEKAMWAGEFDRSIADYAAATEAEQAVRRGIDELLGGRTAFVIAHRLSTVREADRIVVLDRRRIVEQGTHDELMARRSLYWRVAGQQLDA